MHSPPSTLSSYQNLKTEPAFVANEQYNRSQPHKAVNDCCYSISNLALIIGSVIALVFVIKFIQDDLLYEYGEQILSLSFYRQIIFIIVILPLTLLVPLINAASAFFLYGRSKREVGSSLIRVKIFYQVLIALLVFTGLVFVAPAIRYTSMLTKIEFELRRHMSMRYENPFSYDFMNQLQAEYQCCDEPWYRSNHGRIPISCFVQDHSYTTIFTYTCSDVLGSMISTWCSVIAACLVVVLVALAVLLGIDIMELMVLASGKYDVRQREAKLAAFGSNTSLNSDLRSPVSSGSARRGSSGSHKSGDLDNDSMMSRELADALTQSEFDRELQSRVANRRLSSDDPLLTKPKYSDNTPRALGDQLEECHLDSDDNDDNESARAGGTSTPVLTRARYDMIAKARARSPVFLSSGGGSPVQKPTKGVLKKTSSFQRIDTEEDDSDGASFQEHQQQMQRDLQARRSLLNVRFAQ